MNGIVTRLDQTRHRQTGANSSSALVQALLDLAPLLVTYSVVKEQVPPGLRSAFCRRQVGPRGRLLCSASVDDCAIGYVGRLVSAMTGGRVGTRWGFGGASGIGVSGSFIWGVAGGFWAKFLRSARTGGGLRRLGEWSSEKCSKSGPLSVHRSFAQTTSAALPATAPPA